VILGGSKFTDIVLQGPKFKTKKQFWNQKGKPHTMTHGRDHLIVFGRKLNSLTATGKRHHGSGDNCPGQSEAGAIKGKQCSVVQCSAVNGARRMDVQQFRFCAPLTSAAHSNVPFLKGKTPNVMT
jgi:hypothetical protein